MILMEKRMASGLVFKLFNSFNIGDPFHLANILLYNGQLESAVKNYKKGAYENDGRSMYVLAVLLENGIGLKRDSTQYKHWMLKAAQSGHMGAMGECYIDGNGYPKNVSEGFRILKEYAGKNNESFVQGSVGGYYLEGVVVQRDVSEARKWFELSANNKNPFSKEILNRVWGFQPTKIQ